MIGLPTGSHCSHHSQAEVPEPHRWYTLRCFCVFVAFIYRTVEQSVFGAHLASSVAGLGVDLACVFILQKRLVTRTLMVTEWKVGSIANITTYYYCSCFSHELPVSTPKTLLQNLGALGKGTTILDTKKASSGQLHEPFTTSSASSARGALTSPSSTIPVKCTCMVRWDLTDVARASPVLPAGHTHGIGAAGRGAGHGAQWPPGRRPGAPGGPKGGTWRRPGARGAGGYGESEERKLEES